MWPCRKKIKGHPRIIIWTDFVDLESPMLYTKISLKPFLVLQKTIFEVFVFTYMGMVVMQPFKQMDDIPST